MEPIKGHLVKLCATYLRWKNTRLFILKTEMSKRGVPRGSDKGDKNVLECLGQAPLTPVSTASIYQQAE